METTLRVISITGNIIILVVLLWLLAPWFYARMTEKWEDE